MYVSPSMDQAYEKPSSKIQSGLYQASWKNSLRWPLLLVLSGVLLLVLFAAGFGIFKWMSSIEQMNDQARWAESTRQAGLLVQEELENKQQVLTAAGLSNGEETAQILQNLIAQDPSWLEIARFSQDGKLLASAANGSSFLKHSAGDPQQKWLQQARIGQVFVDLAADSQSEQPGLIIALPTTDGGVIAGQISPNDLSEEMATLLQSQAGIGYLINRLDGRVLGYPGQPAGASVSKSQAYRALLERPDQMWQGAVQNLNGEKVLAQSMPVKSTNWTVVIEAKQGDTATFSTQLLPILAGSLILVWVIFTILAGAALEKMVFRPMHAMLEKNPPSTRTDELGQVARHIEQLSTNMHEKEALLNQAHHQLVMDSQFRTDFLARVSHDLRQPMGVILGFAEMLSEEIFGTINKQQRRAVEDILTSTHTLSQGISDLLDTSRLEAQTMHLHTDEFKPELLLRQAVSQVSILAERKELRLETSLDPQMPEIVLGDANRVQQIVYNLAVNAIKFTQKGTVSITFKRYSDDEWGIVVSDTGQGIPDEALGVIFEPFQQVSSQTTRDKGGVGLGLYIVQQLVLLMGGQVQVESIVGSGSTFTVRLPLRTAHAKGS